MRSQSLRLALLLPFVVNGEVHHLRNYWTIDAVAPTNDRSNHHVRTRNRQSTAPLDNQDSDDVQRELLRMFTANQRAQSMRTDTPEIDDLLHDDDEEVTLKPRMVEIPEYESSHQELTDVVVGK
jgi:hypothetical protein